MIDLFKQNLDHYHQLCARQKSGQLSPQQFQTEVRKLRWSDAADAWWTIDPANGASLRYDGTQWAPAQPAQAASPAKRSPAPSSAAPQNLLEFFTILVKNFIRNLPRQILFYLLAMAAVWFINVYVVVYVNNGFNKGSQFSRNYTVEPNSIGPGSMFWFFFGILVSLLISMLSGQRRRALFAGLGSLPTYLRQSFQYCQSNAAVYLLLVGSAGLGLAGLVENPLVRLTWLSFVIGTMLEQQRSLLATFLRLAWLDLQRLVRRRPLVPLNLSISGVLFSGLGLGLLASLPLPASALWIAAAVMLALAVMLFFALRGRRLPGATLFGFAIGLAGLAAFSLLVKTALADDGGWSESGGTLQGWLNNPGSIPFLQTSLIPAIWTALGTMLGSALGSIPAGGQDGQAVDTGWMPLSSLGGQEGHPFTKFDGPIKCKKPGNYPSFLINTATLGLVVQDTIFEGRGSGPHLSIELTYNSGLLETGMFGKGWRFQYESSITQEGKTLLLAKGSGQLLEYRRGTANKKQPEAAVAALPPAGTADPLFDYGSYWLLFEKDSRLFYRYDKKQGARSCPLTSIVDASGNMLQIDYNPDGTIQAITDPAGRMTHFTYHPNRLCASFTLADGRNARYGYSPAGCLVQAVDLHGIIASYEYDGGGLMKRMTVDRDQWAFSFTYQQVLEGKCIAAVTDPAGGITRYEIGSFEPRQVRVIDPLGRATTYHSQDGLTVKAVDMCGGTAQVDYQSGLPVRVQDKKGAVRQMAYDIRGNLVQLTDPAGAITSFAYDVQDHLVSKTDALGGVWRYEYVRDNLTRRISPLGQVETYEYEARGQISALTDGAGKKTTIEYDRFGNVAALVDPLGNAIRTAFDPTGLKEAAITNPRGDTTRMEYDHNNRLVKISHPDGAVRLMQYNCCAVTETVDENGQSWRARRDALMQIAEQATPAGNQTLFVYDKSHRPVQIVDALRRTQGITYDDARRIQSTINPAGQAAHYQFDPVGNLIMVWDENGKTTSYTYDARSLPVRVTDALGQSMTLEYDPRGQPVKLTNRRGDEIHQVYDAEGRLVQKLYQGTEVAGYQYDPNGNLVGVHDAFGWTRFQLDAGDQAVAVQYPDGLQVGLAYDENGGVSRLMYPDGLEVRYTYDSRERIIRLDWNNQAVSFSYDGVGNLTGMARSNGTESGYRYDPQGNLLEISHTQGGQALAQLVYEYDAVGNIKSESGIYPLQPVPAPLARQVTYDNVNQMVSVAGEPCRYDADGNLTTIGSRWQASYDPENRLVDLTRQGQRTYYQYNGIGQRVLAAGPDGVRRFHYDPSGHLLVETGAAGQALAQYIYAGDLLVARQSASGEVFFYHFNQNGSTLALTNHQGQLAAAYAYDPFGAVVNRSGDDQGNPFTYAGAFGVMDESGGLFCMRHRYYDALTGRFIQKDPIGIIAGLNLYAYVANNPIVWIDPDGQKKANWMMILNGLENLVTGTAGVLGGGFLAVTSIVDPLAVPTGWIRIPVITGAISFGVNGVVKGVRQVAEGWNGNPTPQGWEGIRETVIGNIPFVPAVTYIIEGKPVGAIYEGAKELAPKGIGNVIGIFESGRTGGQSIVDCDKIQIDFGTSTRIDSPPAWNKMR